MKEEYCQTCNNILRFPESARKVICDSCESEWLVVRTGSMIGLSPVGSMQVVGQEETLQKRLKEVQRQVLIKEDLIRGLRQEIEGIQVVFKPVPLPAKLGAVVLALFFCAGAAAAWFFKQPLVVPGALVALALSPTVGAVVYGRQINQREREKLLHKKELIQNLAVIKKELDALHADKQRVRDTAVIEE